MSPSALQDRVEGILTVEALKESLEWDFKPTVRNRDRTKTRDFLLKWIDTNSGVERLSLFVRAVTGNKTLNGDPIKIDVGRRDKDFIPIAHTCFNTLDLTGQCKSQEQFNAKLEMLLDLTKAGSGFSAA
jgi:hypothetical protein